MLIRRGNQTGGKKAWVRQEQTSESGWQDGREISQFGPWNFMPNKVVQFSEVGVGKMSRILNLILHKTYYRGDTGEERINELENEMNHYSEVIWEWEYMQEL